MKIEDSRLFKQMKRIGYLYEKIISIENLNLADKKARKGKKYTYGIRKHDKKRESNILMLHEQLKNKTYRTSEYKIFEIYKPKKRTIYQLPYFPDRILHHAVMNIMEPIWCSYFTADTYSCVKGKGIHGVVRYMKKRLKDRENTKYCLKIDIKQYYPSIDHDILKKIVRKKVKDNDLLDLLDEIIDSAPGVPIGNYLSQYFANLYMTPFDHWMKEIIKAKYYARYMDDCVALHAMIEPLHKLFPQMDKFLAEELNLTIKGNYQVFPVEARGVDIVGYVFRHDYILMRKSIKQNFCRKVAKLNRKTNISDADYKQAICSWLGWAKHCDSKNLLNKLKISDL